MFRAWADALDRRGPRIIIIVIGVLLTIAPAPLSFQGVEFLFDSPSFDAPGSSLPIGLGALGLAGAFGLIARGRGSCFQDGTFGKTEPFES